MAGQERIVVDGEDLIFALQFDRAEATYFLNRETGAISFYYEGLFDGEEIDDLDEHLADGDYIKIEGIDSFESYQVMEAFVETLPAGSTRSRLERAISGPKPFRRFKDNLLDLGAIRDEWFKFENESYRKKALAWLERNGIEADLHFPKRVKEA